MATSGSPKKKEIFVTIRKEGGGYVVDGGKVDRIGEKQANNVIWHFHNFTTDQVTVKLHDFAPAPPCPVDAPGCVLTKDYDPNGRGPIHAKLSDKTLGDFTYKISVRNRSSGHENVVDPELQIDGKRSGGATALAIGIAVAVLAFAAYWFLMG